MILEEHSPGRRANGDGDGVMGMNLARAHRVARAGGGDPGIKVDPRICQNR